MNSPIPARTTFYKPFALPELISRVKAVNRRMAGFASQTLEPRHAVFDPVNHQVTLDNELLMLSKKSITCCTS